MDNSTNVGIDQVPRIGYKPETAMFIGEYQHTLDEKGRLALPAKYRADLSSGAVVTRGLDRCLFLYPRNEWEKLASRLAALPIAQSNTRAIARLMLAGAMDVTPDKMGRMLIPEYLREYASLERSVVLSGLYNRLEIWNAGEWEKYKQATEAQSADIAEKLGELGL
ncbi:MAG: division/cell wall cluster transcriptional repressor MraZ [Patescibacteria group bacterium]